MVVLPRDISKVAGYSSWAHMHQRCYNPRDKDYHLYGGRGIKVCSRWMRARLFFRDMGPRPVGMELDRIDNDKDYYKDNCRWATRTTQNRNRRYVKLSVAIANQLRKEFDGTSSFYKRKAQEFGCSESAIRAVIARRNYK